MYLTVHSACLSRKRSSGELSDTLTLDPSNILGVRIQHNWREKGNQSKWKGTVLDRLSVNPSLFMVKYDGFDCVYGIELFKDERVSNLQVLSEKVGEFAEQRGADATLYFTCVNEIRLLAVPRQ